MQDRENIAIASDHAAFKLKEFVKTSLKDSPYQLIDLGCDSEDSCDYPEYAKKLCEFMLDKPKEQKCDRGILLCGSGIGMSIAANRYKGIRAALCHNAEFAGLSRSHNNANVLVLPARFLSEAETEEILETWLSTEFLGDRHQRRVDQIDD